MKRKNLQEGYTHTIYVYSNVTVRVIWKVN